MSQLSKPALEKYSNDNKCNTAMKAMISALISLKKKLRVKTRDFV